MFRRAEALSTGLVLDYHPSNASQLVLVDTLKAREKFHTDGC